MMNNTAYIIGGVRSPIGNFGGILSTIRADDLLAQVIKTLVDKFPTLPVFEIADVIIGCANQAGEDNRNVARMALLLADLPFTIPGETVNRLCASGMAAVVQAQRAIQAGHGELFIAGGVEHMTRSPWVISKTSTAFGRDAQMFDSSFGWRFVNPKMQEIYGTEAMGETAENLAELFNISREDQDSFAFWSQQKAKNASECGFYDEEITQIYIPQKKAEPILALRDEFLKPHTTLEALAKLKPVFRKGGTVTAGNSSGLNDGAAALYIAGERIIQQYAIEPIAAIKSMGVVGVEPRIMGIGPVEASHLALKRAGLTLDQMDLIEINEAFSAQVLACTRTLGLKDDDPRINPQGGAIALGHPLGMSGARILLSAALQLKRNQWKYALCTMCIGVGQGYAVVLENPNL